MLFGSSMHIRYSQNCSITPTSYSETCSLNDRYFLSLSLQLRSFRAKYSCTPSSTCYMYASIYKYFQMSRIGTSPAVKPKALNEFVSFNEKTFSDNAALWVNSLIYVSSRLIKIVAFYAAYKPIVKTKTKESIAPHVVLNDSPPFSLKFMS